MSSRSFYVTTSIPYVNAQPHLGHALEFVQADVLARHRRRRGEHVRLLSGTDDNALKNVLAAEQAGVPVRDFVDANAGRFCGLQDPLDLRLDDFIRTSADDRHRPAVERIWEACRARGDLYRGAYEGLYCEGCEQFYEPDELEDGRCPEHWVEPKRVCEENWFFRLSRYESELIELVSSNHLRIEPAGRRNEILAFLRRGLRDVSVSRSAARAGGWGIPVPGDGDQVVYVWFDALVNYISALGFGTEDGGYREWWVSSDERVHVIGKGILRFHAVWWPAILLSAGEPLPTTVVVHDYLTAGRRKLSKSAGGAADPYELVDRYGTDAVRWWLVRDVARIGDTDFTEERLVQRYNEDLAGGIGNLILRTTALAGRLGTECSPREFAAAEPLRARLTQLPDEIDRALADFDLRRATGAILAVVSEANRLLEATRPWERGEEAGPGLKYVLEACRAIVTALEPFLPSASDRLAGYLHGGWSGLPFPRLA